MPRATNEHIQQRKADDGIKPFANWEAEFRRKIEQFLIVKRVEVLGIKLQKRLRAFGNLYQNEL